MPPFPTPPSEIPIASAAQVTYGFNPNDPEDTPQQVSTYIDGFYLSSTTILGPIRLRQLRVRNDVCEARVRRPQLRDVRHTRWTDGGMARATSGQRVALHSLMRRRADMWVPGAAYRRTACAG